MQLDYKANFYLVDKPAKYTSQDICSIVKKKYSFNKVGHSGTLDPLATGLMILATNSYTKLLTFVIELNKCYEFTAKFGYMSESGDINSDVVQINKNYQINIDLLEKNMQSFVGEIIQQPPIYSAIKVKGKRLYKYARENLEVDIPKRKVKIKNLKLEKVISKNEVRISTCCSKGTYVRSLVKDIAKSLDTHAVVTELRRTKIDKISVTDSNSFEDLLAAKDSQIKEVSYKEILSMKSIQVDEIDLEKIRNGNFIKSSFFNNKDNYLLIFNNKVVAVYEKYNQDLYKPTKVLL